MRNIDFKYKLLKQSLLILSILLYSVISYPQTFEKYYISELDDYVYDAIPINDNEVVLSINSGNFLLKDYQSKLYKINHISGALIDSTDVMFNHNLYSFGGVQNLFLVNDSIIVVHATCRNKNDDSHTFFLAHYNLSLDLIFDTLIIGEDLTIFDMHLMGDSIFLLTGMYQPFTQFIQERDIYGQLIRQQTYNFVAHLASTIFRSDEHYHVYLHFDNYHRYVLINVNDLSIDTILQYPQGFLPRNSIKSPDNLHYYIAGRMGHISPDFTFNLACLKVSNDGYNLELFDYHTDSLNYYTIHSFSLNSDHIFFGGTQMLTWPASHEFFMFPGPRWLLLYKLTHDGDIVWQKFYKGEVDYMMYKVLATPDGGVLIFSTRYDWNDPIPNQRDVHILKVDSDGNYVVGIDEVKIEAKQILVYPNPATDKINFAFGLYNKLEISIFDNQGRLLHSNTYQQSASIDIAHFKPGMYFYTIHSLNGFVESGKFIKQ